MSSKLPAAAFNLKDQRLLPFSESKNMTKSEIFQFVTEYLNGKIIPWKPKRDSKLNPELSKVEAGYMHCKYLEYE